MNWDALDISILGPALMAGLLVAATHVPLGRSVIQRGIIFIDLAIAQMAGLGIIAAAAMGWDVDGWQVQMVAVTAAGLGALLLHWTEQRFAEIQEALIGVSFVLAATLGILLLANNPHGGEHLRELLVGQILWVSYEQLWPVALLYAAVLTLWFTVARQGEQSRLWFYSLFAVTVTASVQLVGVYLVFATLIVPALASRKLHQRKALVSGWIMAALGYALGLVASALFNWPSGAVIVWALSVVALVGAWFNRPSGKA
jgi:zinc/manganese transport system permease protein